MLVARKDVLHNYHEHDSLLENKIDEELSEEDRKAAWDDYENDKKGLVTNTGVCFCHFLRVAGKSQGILSNLQKSVIS